MRVVDPNFWHQRWERGETAFHEQAGNTLLVKHFPSLSLPEGARVFVPLCGKTRDIHWLLRNGYRVAGAELSPIAVDQLFADLGVTPTITAVGSLRRYHAEGIDIFQGDLFELTRETLGPVDAVYDRAALVALPEPMRRRYAAHLSKITKQAPQLLIVFEYDQTRMEGPPFSISDREIKELYGESHGTAFLEAVDVPGGLKGKCVAKEKAWRLGTETSVVREIYDALNRNDIPAVLSFFDPQIVRVEFEGLPSSGTYRGLEEVKAHFERGRGTWAEGGCEPERFLVSGDKVLVFVHVRVKLKENQKWVEGDTTDVFTFKNGKVIEMRTFAERQKALDWAGIEDDRHLKPGT